jgi:hypothetical protein
LALRGCVIRLSANGALDTAFGSAGRSGVQGMLNVNRLRLDCDGRIVAIDGYLAIRCGAALN